MTMDLKELCRLCAKKDEFTKDLLHDSHQHLLKLIKEFVHIVVNDNDHLPTKICLNCEEKMVDFQLFVLECCNVQKTLKDLCGTLPVKVETFIEENQIREIKSEVKDDEIATEEILDEFHNDTTIPEVDEDDYQEANEFVDCKEATHVDDYQEADRDDDAVDDDDDDNFTIASLKQIKNLQLKKKVMTDEEVDEFRKVLKRRNFKVKDIVKLKCNVCEDGFKSWTGLHFHYMKQHKLEPLVFCTCGFVIRSKSVLYKHVSDHKVEGRKLREDSENNDDDKQEESKYSNLNVRDFINFVCNECQKVCSSWDTLKKHCQRLHKTLPVVNCICGIALKSKTVLYKHVGDHKNPNVLACDKCPRITTTIEALNKHKMRHIPKSERRFNCSSCDKVFNNKKSLKSHQQSHVPVEQRKIYSCEICDLKFTTRSSAASHKQVVHEKIKSYVCDFCGYAFGTISGLRQHRVIHSDDKAFVCRKCSKRFKMYSNLKTHMDTHEDTSYVCNVCSRVLNSRRTLRKHLLVHEDKCRHVCSYCNKAYKRRQSLKVHMYIHTGDKPLTCKWCDEGFAYASTLRSHRLRCHADKMAAQAHNAYNTIAQSIYDEILKHTGTSEVEKNDVENI